jgi:urease beta subunit
VAIPSGKTIRFKPGKDLQVSDEVEIKDEPDTEESDFE